MSDPPRRLAFRWPSASIRRWKWRLLVRPRTSTVERIKARKAERLLAEGAYVDGPSVSVIVQSFNQVRNIHVLETRLRQTCADELIVCEDGSIDGSTQEWLSRLVNPNDFLLHSNDLHEIRAYNRAVRYAGGEIICLMQDDDKPPRDGRWLQQALDVFGTYPHLAVLGGWCGFDEYFAVEYNAPWSPSGDRPIPTLDPTTRLPLMFVENVNIGPFLVRKSIFDALGGFDLRFSSPGEPGITFEAEFCYRAWLHGHQVALTDIPVKRESGDHSYILPGGTSMWGEEERNRNERTNKALIESIYDPSLPAIQASVRSANLGLRPRELERNSF